MKNIYFDHAATTYIKDEVLEKMLPYLGKYFENPSSIYFNAIKTKKAIEDSRSKIAKALNCERKEIYFTSSATESNNWALKGLAFANKKKGNHIITTKIEHPSILESCYYLEQLGFKITYLPVDEYGLISLKDLENAITDKTILISIMFANNEIGTIQPIKQIGEIAERKKIYFHTDAVQAVGKLPINLKEYKIDMLTLSGHKIYGPKGIGALFIKDGVNIENFIHGGSQENGMRAGTENVANCVGLGYALELATKNIKDKMHNLTLLRDKLITTAQLNIGCCKLNGHPTERLSNNINLSIRGVNGKKLVESLDKCGIKCSSGSACSCGSRKPSHVLLSLGLPEQLAIESIRITLGDNTTIDEIDYFIEQLIQITNDLRIAHNK